MDRPVAGHFAFLCGLGADRVLMLGVNADRYSPVHDGRPPGPKTMLLVWELKAGETCTGWVVRPYRAYAADLPVLRARDWAKEMEAAKQEWHALLSRASRLTPFYSEIRF